MKMDSHCHTNCSDGSISICERIEMIRKLNYDAATITDHDFISLKQVKIAVNACQEIPYIPGIELTADEKGKIVHILGYFVEPENEDLQEHIKEIDNLELSKTKKIIKNLKEKKISIEMDELENNSLHSAHYLNLIKVLAKKLDFDKSLIFKYYMGAMIETNSNWTTFCECSVQKAINLIHKAGGVAVLAHPGFDNDPFMRPLGFLNNTEKEISLFTEWGLDGIECHCPSHSKEQYRYFEKMAEKFDLGMTEGSDCHGNDEYLGPSLMDKFQTEFDDGYERILHIQRKRYGKRWNPQW